MRLFRFVTILCLSIFILSCSKDEEERKQPTTEDLARAFPDVKEKAPRSQKIESTIDKDGIDLNAPKNALLEGDSDLVNKLDLLTKGESSSSVLRVLETDVFGWQVANLDGDSSDYSNREIFIFDLDGTYTTYSYSDWEWNWGYYYVDSSFSKLMLNPGSEIEKVWSIDEINTTEFNYEAAGANVNCIPIILPNAK